MAKKVVIVESPAKARTLKKYLGDGYSVVASMGHIRDLPESRLAVDVENDFKPSYTIPKDKRKVIEELRAAVKGASKVILASDPDREGEAIAWHLANVLKLDNPERIEFHEITKDAVLKALQSPRKIDMNLVNAQQARRVVDRLVGYELSPFLWEKVKRGLSAGRVQSVALRFVCDREKEINEFVPEVTWEIQVILSKGGQQFKAKLYKLSDGGKAIFKEEEAANRVNAVLPGASYLVKSVEVKQKARQAPLPYITSTMQQDASSKLHIGPKKAMMLAQQLYEGLEIGDEGPVGLITYMRTDSTRISQVAIEEAHKYIREQYGENYVGKPREPKQKAGVQDAHEAIRPTSVYRTPEKVKPYLTNDQFALYELIWKRFVASLMAPAKYSTITAEIDADGNVLRASGSKLVFEGFFKIWERENDDQEEEIIPLDEGDRLDYVSSEVIRHETQPPPRYTEATLIKELEEKGIGRPSTYATIVDTIQTRGYVEQRDHKLYPTPLGLAINELLKAHFKKIVDEKYTAEMEKHLDEIEEGKAQWVPVVRAYYEPLVQMIKEADKQVSNHTGEICPECGKGELVLRASRHGQFLGCTNYPECRYIKPLSGESVVVVEIDETCPECGRKLVKRKSRYGEFIGCSGYPKCRYVRPIPVQENTNNLARVGAKCPSCGSELVWRKGPYGWFIACSSYPECSFVAGRNGQVAYLEEKCPKCGGRVEIRKGRFGFFGRCENYPTCNGIIKISHPGKEGFGGPV